MIRTSEMVLPGHPDKFCDQIADTIVSSCLEIDSDSYCQVEVGVWSDSIWLSGGLVTRRPLNKTIPEIVVETGVAIGYTVGNWINASNYKITSLVCMEVGDPIRYTAKVNDQSIAIGYAGYDKHTRFLPPEHFLAHTFREALFASFTKGPLAGNGPDGKLMLRMREDQDGWNVEHILVTLQQRADIDFMLLCGGVNKVLKGAYDMVRESDRRWKRKWEDIELLVNPNGPLLNGGSDGDNGQTGRKLVMDFYGPRIPIGGGALSGKDLSHIDRAASYAARHAAMLAVQSGAHECFV